MSQYPNPIIVETRMSDYGYWVITVSVTAWQRMSVMICSTGIDRTTAETTALATISGISARRA